MTEFSTVFNAFVLLAARALGAQTREAEYLEEAKRWSKDQLGGVAAALGALIIKMEDKPFTDILGGIYVEFAQSKDTRVRGGAFYTPQCISADDGSYARRR